MKAKRNIIPIFVPHLGCPNDCVFCNQRKISGSLVPANAETVKATVTQALERIPDKSNIQLAFYGGSFTAIPLQEQNELLDAALPFLHEGVISSLRLSTRPDAIDADTLVRLRERGVKTIELGAQSMCDEVLEVSGRGHTALETVRAARLIKEYGFELILQMMTGLPKDTKQRSIETAEGLIALKPDGVRIYPTVIIENTALFDMWRAGTYPEHTVEQAVETCAAILPMFERAGIDVIRLGLNPTEELTDGAAVAGAYHPAFGELVKSRIFLDKARALLSGSPHGDTVTLNVSKADVSAMTGQKRANVIALCKEFSLKSLRVSAVDVQKNSVFLS